MDEKYPLSKWYNNIYGGLRKKLQIGYEMAVNLKNLNHNGMTCDKLKKAEFVIPSDMFKVSMIKDDRYIAPELIDSCAMPNSLTDIYSYSVVLFELLGDMVTDELKHLFKLVFEESLDNNLNRPSVDEFIDAILKGLDSIVECSNDKCKSSFYYNENKMNKCPYCETENDEISKLKFVKAVQTKDEFILDSENIGKYKRIVASESNDNILVLNEGIQYINKRHFEEISDYTNHEDIIAIRVKNKKVYVKLLKDIKIYILDRERKKMSLLKLDEEREIVKNKNAIILEKNFDIINEKTLDTKDIFDIYKEVIIRNYAALC